MGHAISNAYESREFFWNSYELKAQVIVIISGVPPARPCLIGMVEDGMTDDWPWIMADG